MFAIAIVVLGAVGIVAPASLVAISRSFLSPTGLYVAAGIRLTLGTVLVLAAPASRAPKTLRILGVVTVVGGIVTPLFGVDRARTIVEWMTTQGTAFMRIWGAIALVLGLFLAYAAAHG